MSSLDEAIAAFPVITWASQYTTVYDKGGRNVYADCPICSGKKTLGIEREKKIFHCFKCNEGGRGGDIWNGKAHVTRMIRLVTGISWNDTIELIYRMSGFPDPPRQKKSTPIQLLPKEAEPLKDASNFHPGVIYLTYRKMQHLQNTSYFCRTGQYKDRVILPAYFLGEMIGYEAKSSIKGVKPPSLFPDWMDTYSYVYTTSINWESKFLIVTESIFDAETFGSNAIGCYGGFKEGHLPTLLNLRKKGLESLIWALDWDAWKKQSKAILTKTVGLFNNYVVNMPYKKDPNDLGREACWNLLNTRLRISDELDMLQAEIKFSKL